MGKSQDEQTTTQQVNVPDFLQPLTRQGAQAAQEGLGGLRQRLNFGDPNLIEPFDPLQIRGQEETVGLAGMIPSADLLRRGQNVMSSVAGGNNRLFDEAGNIIDEIGEQGQLPGQTQETLRETARGDFLFGNEGFNEAVDASIRQAQPQIASTFASQGGRGAIDSGLAQTAMQQAASDAFAQQFGQERQRQQQAAQSLGQLGLQQQQQNLQGPLALGRLLEGERTRQLQAAQELPMQALMRPELLQEIGGRRQQQGQQELLEQIRAQQMLMGQGINALQGPSALFGQQQSNPIDQGSPAMSGLGGALAGAQLGSVVPGLGTAVGAGIGGTAGLLSGI